MRSIHVLGCFAVVLVSAAGCALPTEDTSTDFRATYDAVISVDSHFVCSKEPGCSVHVMEKVVPSLLIHATLQASTTPQTGGSGYTQIEIGSISCAAVCGNDSFVGFRSGKAVPTQLQDEILTFGTLGEPQLLLSMPLKDATSNWSAPVLSGAAIWRVETFYPIDNYYGSFTATRR